MRRATVLVPLLLMAACAATAQQRELQYAKAIKGAQDATITALDFDVITADEGEIIQVATRTATEQLKAAIKARREGQPRPVYEAMLEAVIQALNEASRILEGRQ